MFEVFATTEAWISLATLALLEIVLGIDNLVFISILAGRLPEDKRPLARRLGLALALVSRLALLASISWLMRLDTALFEAFGQPMSGRDLILVGGGLFLIAKATLEIYDKVEAPKDEESSAPSALGSGFVPVLLQIMVLDIVFSLDSVITAVGMVDELVIMAAAIVLAVLVMLIFANPVGDFVEGHPSIKILALSFLVLIGVLLLAEGTGRHFEKGYVYFAMSFALAIEMLNMRYRSRSRRRRAS